MRIILVLLFLLASYASAQGKKTVAMGVFGEEGTKFKAMRPLKQRLESALLKEGKFRIVDRTNDILKLLRTDFEYDAGTMVSDDDARQIGDILKADYLCIVESSSTVENYFLLKARLVSVEEQTSATVRVQSNLSSQQDINRAVDELISQFFKRPGGLFLDPKYRMNPLSLEFANSLKRRVSFKDGPCIANSMVIQINVNENGCEGQNSITCSIYATLEGTGCTDEAELHLKGMVKATDRTEKAAMDVAKRELLSGRPNFIGDWIEELKPWVGK